MINKILLIVILGISLFAIDPKVDNETKLENKPTISIEHVAKEKTFIERNESAVFALIGTFLMAIMGYGYNLLLASKKNAYNLTLKELEQKYKISEETYQNLFEEKIKTYTTLHQILIEHRKKLLNIGLEEYDEDESGYREEYTIEKKDVYVSFIRILEDNLKPNMFYISKEFEEKFLEISLALAKGDVTIQNEFMFGGIDSQEAEKLSKEQGHEFYKKHSSSIDELILLLESETRLIKEKIDFN